MKYSMSLAALAAVAVAAPAEKVDSREPSRIEARAACTTAVTLAAGSNPFSGRKLHANSFYASEIATAVEAISDASLKAKAAAVANVGSFLWL